MSSFTAWKQIFPLTISSPFVHSSLTATICSLSAIETTVSYSWFLCQLPVHYAVFKGSLQEHYKILQDQLVAD